MADISSLIAQLGFPIVAYLLVYCDLRKIVKSNTEALNSLSDSVNVFLRK